MQQLARIGSVWALLLALIVTPAVWAQDKQASDKLQKATELFAQQEYEAAQETLRGVDREKLGEDDRAGFDLLRQAVVQAIAANEAAKEKLASADRAFAAGNWDAADALYQAVLANEFAKSALKAKAKEQRESVAEKKRLAQAAEPEGVIASPAEPAAPSAEQAEPAPAPAVLPGRRLTPIEEMQLHDRLLWQRAEQQAKDQALKAREAVANRQFSIARQLADQAIQTVEAARTYAEPVALYLAAKDAALRLKQEVADAIEADQRHETDVQRKQIGERIAEARAQFEQQRREKIEQLFNTATQLRKQLKFEEAAEVLRQIIFIDPANAKARDQLEIAEDYASSQVQRSWERDLQKQTRSALVSAEDALIPWDYEVLYPKNWLELTAKRSAAGIGAGSQEEEGELNRKLKEILPEFDFQEAPLENVIEHLQEVQRVNIAVDWDDLTSSGIERDKPVSVQLRGLPFGTVLKEVLAQVGGDRKLSFSITDGLLRIATKDKLDRNKVVLVYDIRDLLVCVPRFNNAATMDPAQALSQGAQGGGGGQQLFQSTQQQRETEANQQRTTDIVQKIMEIIRQTVEPDSWVEAGGGEGSIRELNGQLIIYNTSEAHTQIRGLLDQLRATRALQIAVEARFLNVTSNFLEEFGVDLDFVFNTGTAGYDRGFTPAGQGLVDPFTGGNVLIPRQYSRIGSTAAIPAFGNPMPQVPIAQPYSQAGFVPPNSGLDPHFTEMTPIGAQQNSIGLADPSQLTTGVPGTFAQRVAQPALNIAGSFLDNLQVDFLIRATQANLRSSIVQAPRLVMFNGQRANISVGRSRQYVSSVTPQVAEGAVAVQPVIGNAPSGTVLVVDGTISADRRYVTITVETTQTDEPTFERFEVQRASGNSAGIFILLPDQAFVTINTTVSIPDGGTVLLGGLKQVGEAEVEAGVPILSKIPILKRAFSNRSMVKDTRTLLILMKAKIIIQKEAEEEAFPTFGATGGA
jgi:general secretion pathway protein D